MTAASPLDALRQEVRIGTARTGLWGAALAITAFIVWGMFAELDEVAVAAGEVIPSEQLQVVQHLEGGVIESIAVREGDPVASGDLLMRLNLAAGGINREELLSRRDGLLLTQARLKAEIAGADPAFPPDLRERRPAMAQAEMQTFEARRSAYESDMAVLSEKVQQRHLQVAELTAGIRAMRNDLELARQRLSMSADLLEEGLTPRMEHVEIEAEVERLVGQIDVLERKLARARGGISEAEAEQARERQAFRRRASEEMSTVERDLSAIRETLNTATDQVRRAEVRSPIDGIVKNLRTSTVGGVVRPGEPIVEIVPVSDALEVVARLDPKDRGYVEAGQRAVVKVSTYDYARYGGLEGTVERISASTNTDDQTGQPYYEVVVITKQTHLGDAEGEFPITPGMQATVDIHTGTRTVLDYLVRPVLKLQHEAFRER